MLAAYQVLLHRYTGQDDIIVGSPANGRDRAAFAGVMGDFINPVAIRGDLSGNPSFSDVLAGIRGKVLAAFDHDGYPFSLLVERLQPPRGPSHPPIFQTLFVMRRAQASLDTGVRAFMLGQSDARMDLAGLDMQSYSIEQRHAQFDLVCQVAEADGQLSIELQYNTDVFDGATIRRLASHFRILLTGIVADPSVPIDDLPLLDDDERQQLLVDWNSTSCARFPPN